ncbi:hypothetical protein JCGZ_26664 [Jatropha curcas]|uniref:Small nuclear ribonucleoprotein G n=1 Tax=Jatropha curcas TaxID=180498 RepID=A0A067L3T7_JATCU|nr:hypothetical protein JCGZ_26664 [Jatropha curcas]
MSRSGQPPDLKKYMDKKLQRFQLNFLLDVWLFDNFHLVNEFTAYMASFIHDNSALERCKRRAFFKLNANRMVVGTLRGFDQFMNLVVDNTVEVNGDEKNDIGMVVIRGNSVVTVEALEPVNKTQ